MASADPLPVKVQRELGSMAWYWDDMAYKGGPMISPEMMRRFMMPRYRELNEAIHEGGCEVILLDLQGKAVGIGKTREQNVKGVTMPFTASCPSGSARSRLHSPEFTRSA